MRRPPLLGHGWHAWVGSFTGVVAVTLALLPVAVLVAALLARRRVASGTAPGRAWRLSLSEIGLVWGTAPSVWMTMVPGSSAGGAGA